MRKMRKDTTRVLSDQGFIEASGEQRSEYSNEESSNERPVTEEESQSVDTIYENEEVRVSRPEPR